MMWLTWRQFRAQSIAAGAALAVLAVILAVTGMRLAHLYDTSGLASCTGGCGQIATQFVTQMQGDATYKTLFYAGLAVLFIVPAIIGAFWGAPLVTREVEAGTFRLAWNQSVTRTRWLAVKLGLIGLAAMVTAGLFSLMISWWASPIDRAVRAGGGSSVVIGTRLDPLVFGARGIAPVGYAAFAFALGVTAGVLIRRTVPAMAATLAGFAFVQIAWPSWIRPHLITPVQVSTALNPGSINSLEMSQNGRMTVLAGVNKPGAWLLSNQTITPAGRLFTGPAPQACGKGSFQACAASLGKLHLRQLVTYQPGSRFWAFQWYETAIFVVLALALAAFCAWRIRSRRLT
jgi:hypothetical protein